MASVQPASQSKGQEVQVTVLNPDNTEVKGEEGAEEGAEERVSMLVKRAPVLLEWRNVCFSIAYKDNEKQNKVRSILNGISGYAEPGQLLAIMGASGAGKTTLLNVLSRRQGNTSVATLKGDILVNGAPIEQAVFKHHSAYIMQDDILMDTLTPRELLEFSAKLRLPRTMSDAEKKARVNKVIQELALESCADTIIGSPLRRGISGGERKRVSIGVELITDPGLLFVDEPTSGLDSDTAHHVVDLLKDLAKAGRTVICTIHQPSSDIYSLFDQLMLMVSGKAIYFGRGRDAVRFFGEVGYPCPSYTNPADYFMKVMNGEASKPTHFQKMVSLVESQPSPNFSSKNHIPLAKKSSDRIPFHKQVSLLSLRAMKNFMRQPILLRMRLVQLIVIGLFAGLIYLQIGHDQTSIQDRNGVLFFTLISAFMPSVMGIVLTFPGERALFLRERSNNMYGTGSYFLSKTMAELPFQIAFPMITSIIVYFMVDLHPGADRFFIFYAALLLVTNVGQSVGMIIACGFSNAEAAIGITPVAIIPFMLFAGFFVNADSIPVYFIWLKFISPFKYGFEILVVNEYKDLELYCSPSQLVGNGLCPVTNGEKVLANLGIEESHLARGFYVLLGLFLGFRILAFFILRHQSSKKVG